jgi:hypothetical protein
MNDDIACKVECSDILARLAWALDRGESAEAAGYFTDDAALVTPAGTTRGADIRKAMDARPASVVTRHLILNLVVDRTGPDTAKALSQLIMYRLTAQEDPKTPMVLPASPQALGEWRIDLRKTDAGWRISRYEAVGTAAAAP